MKTRDPDLRKLILKELGELIVKAHQIAEDEEIWVVERFLHGAVIYIRTMEKEQRR